MDKINYNLVYLFILLIQLTACTVVKVKEPTPAENPFWHDHKKQIVAIKEWHSQGRFAAQGEENSWTGNFQWANSAASYKVTISAPLSGGSMVLKGNAEKSTLTLEDNRSFTEASANDLLHKYSGLKLPVDELKFWLIGLPSPEHEIESLTIAQSGFLQQLRQKNWDIQFKRYRKVESINLPNKIFLNNHDFDVRLVVQRWEYTNSE